MPSKPQPIPTRHDADQPLPVLQEELDQDS